MEFYNLQKVYRTTKCARGNSWGSIQAARQATFYLINILHYFNSVLWLLLVALWHVSERSFRQYIPHTRSSDIKILIKVKHMSTIKTVSRTRYFKGVHGCVLASKYSYLILLIAVELYLPRKRGLFTNTHKNSLLRLQYVNNLFPLRVTMPAPKNTDPLLKMSAI